MVVRKKYVLILILICLSLSLSRYEKPTDIGVELLHPLGHGFTFSLGGPFPALGNITPPAHVHMCDIYFYGHRHSS